MTSSFHRASTAPAPDLWDEVLRRTSGVDDLSSTDGEDRVQRRPSRRMLLVPAAAAIVAIAVGIGALASDERDERVSSQGATPTSAPDGSTSSTAAPWYDDDGNLILEAIPDMIPVNICVGTTRPPDLGCKGYVDSRLVYPQLQPPDAPINSHIGYQPGPSPVFDENGDLYGYLVPDVLGVIPVAEFDPDVYGEPEHLPPR